MRRVHCLALIASLVLAGTAAARPPADGPAPPQPAGAEALEFFEARVRPLLVERCFACHSGAKPQGGLDLRTRTGLLKGGSRGAALVPGDAAASRLLRAVRHEGDLKMPPTGKLAPAEIAALEEWVRAGAPWPSGTQRASSKGQGGLGPNRSEIRNPKSEIRNPKSEIRHWAFQPVRPTAVPQVKDRAWVRTPVDAFILAELEKRGLRPSPPADRRTLVRRAYYDLIGLPPTAEEVEAFLTDCRAEDGRSGSRIRTPNTERRTPPGAWERLLDRLLASPHYGERWGRYWLDVARYADTKGYVYTGERRYPFAYTYRDWVIRALNEDMPYDQFLVRQIAADCLPADENDESLAALGFLTLGRRFVNMQHDIIDDRIDVVTRGTMALTVQCARCHDHKYDPLPTADYYSLYGILAGSTERTVRTGPEPALTPAYEAYASELGKRQAAFDQAMDKARAELSERLRARITDYLLLVPDAAKLPGEEFYVIMGADDVNPILVRSWRAYVDRFASPDHPVWGPWHAFEALPPREFAARAGQLASQVSATAGGRLNPRIAAAFTGPPPGGMADVARRYGEVLAATHRQWLAAVKGVEQGSTPPAALPDAADEALRQFLYASDSPASIPRLRISELEYYFDEKTRNELNELQARIDRWQIESSATPPHALALEELPHQPNPRIFLRGNPSNKGPEVPRQFPAVIAGAGRQPFAEGSGRLELARAIASRSNPLTARVIVNRVWLGHFGAGLVATPSDFGLRSELPSHPGLLDWLAWGFAGSSAEGSGFRVQSSDRTGRPNRTDRTGSSSSATTHSSSRGNGSARPWSLKRLHRLIMLSNTYQQSSEPGPGAGPANPKSKIQNPKSADPTNRSLWRMNRRRLDFEALRDSLLSASGHLDRRFGGPSVNLLSRPFSGRRTVYGVIDRQNLPGLLRVFDVAHPDRHSPQRHVTTSPQQALFMLNSPFMLEHARRLAARPEVTGATGAAERIRALYRLVYAREPTAAQLGFGTEFVATAEREADPPPSGWLLALGLARPPLSAWEQYAQALLAANEFIFVD